MLRSIVEPLCSGEYPTMTDFQNHKQKNKLILNSGFFSLSTQQDTCFDVKTFARYWFVSLMITTLMKSRNVLV